MNKRAAAALVAAGMAIGATGGALGARELTGTVYVRFEQQLPDGGTRDLGRTGCYELGPKVRAVVEACGAAKPERGAP